MDNDDVFKHLIFALRQAAWTRDHAFALAALRDIEARVLPRLADLPRPMPDVSEIEAHAAAGRFMPKPEWDLARAEEQYGVGHLVAALKCDYEEARSGSGTSRRHKLVLRCYPAARVLRCCLAVRDHGVTDQTVEWLSDALRELPAREQAIGAKLRTTGRSQRQSPETKEIKKAMAARLSKMQEPNVSLAARHVYKLDHLGTSPEANKDMVAPSEEVGTAGLTVPRGSGNKGPSKPPRSTPQMTLTQNTDNTSTARRSLPETPDRDQQTVPNDAPLAADPALSLTAALPVLKDEADRAARRLVRRLGLPSADVDDLRQDLLLDLIRRFPAFDRTRGTLGAFAGAVVPNEASRIARMIVRDRRRWNGAFESLEALTAEDAAVGDRLAESDGLSAWHGQIVADPTAIVDRLDLHHSLERLNRDERDLYAASGEHSVQRLVEQGFGSRATVYRRLHRVRCVLVAGGVTA